MCIYWHKAWGRQGASLQPQASNRRFSHGCADDSRRRRPRPNVRSGACWRRRPRAVACQLPAAKRRRAVAWPPTAAVARSRRFTVAWPQASPRAQRTCEANGLSVPAVAVPEGLDKDEVVRRSGVCLGAQL